MLSPDKLTKLSKEKKIGASPLADHIVRSGLKKTAALAAVKNWKRGKMTPCPRKGDIANLAKALGVEVNEISEWVSSYRYAPGSARKARLVSAMVVGRDAQDAIDLLNFTSKRAASMLVKVLKAAIADADEHQADVDNLYVSSARIDDAGIRIGTKRWIAKDRGRAHPIRKTACHMYVTVTESK